METPGRFPILIVFTDEHNSSKRDLDLVQQFKNKPGSQIKQILREARLKVFSSLAKELDKLQFIVDGESKRACTILKNVGDQLIAKIYCFNSPQNVVTAIEAVKRSFEAFFPETTKQADQAFSSLRVAIHCISSEIEHMILEGSEDLDSLVSDLSTFKAVWPSLEHLRDDVFGPPMNYATRLIGFPKFGVFVLSEEVVEAAGGVDMVPQTWNLSKIPFLSAKGFDLSFDENEVKYIYEFDSEKVKDKETLLYQMRSVKTLRIVDVAEQYLVSDSFAKQDRSGKLPIESVKTAVSSIIAGSPEDFFIDSLFIVLNWWQGFSMTESRDFSATSFNASPFSDGLFNFKQLSSMPLLALFTATPDEHVDNLLRDRLSSISEQREQPRWRLVPKSYRIHDKKPSRERPSKDNLNTFVLIQFQARHEYIRQADNINFFFGQAIGGHVPDIEEFLEVDYGLTVGIKDGFLLYGCRKNIQTTSDFSEVKTEIEENLFVEICAKLKMTDDIFGKIIPTDVFLLVSPTRDFPELDLLKGLRL